MKINLPEGYEVPDGAKPGEPFDVVATLVQEEDGSFELTAIEGIEIEESESEDDDEGEGMTEDKMKGIKIPWEE